MGSVAVHVISVLVFGGLGCVACPAISIVVISTAWGPWFSATSFSWLLDVSACFTTSWERCVAVEKAKALRRNQLANTAASRKTMARIKISASRDEVVLLYINMAGKYIAWSFCGFLRKQNRRYMLRIMYKNSPSYM